MRNLKKILALVLALVMSLSLMATAGASQFPDVDESNPYATAIDVLDELKVFQGFDDGTFKPTETLNRAQAAALVYRIATGDVEGKYVDNYTYMAQSKFNDLEGYGWARGYINYCQNAEIVVGTSATTFDPGAKVTGYQLLVMLLRTLGYGKAGEFADPKGWELQTATIAEREGILKNITSGDLGAAAPRQMVAEILFQGLLAPTVEYTALSGYAKGETLGKKNLGLEKLEGIVMANEYASLTSASTLADGKTALKTEDKTYTLNIGSTLDDIGEYRYTYVIPASGSRNSDLVCTGLFGDESNVTFESTDKADIGNDSKFASVTGMNRDSETEAFINFDNGSDAYTAKIRIQYWIDTDEDGTFNKDNDETGLFSLNHKLTPAERTKLYDIFRDDAKMDGWVVVGTKDLEEKNDISNDMTWDEFCEKYLEDSNNPVKVSANDNGNWIKAIDNNNDGVAEYIFKVVYTFAQVSRVKDDTVTLDVKNQTLDETSWAKIGHEDKDINELTDEPVVCADELGVGDVVYYAIIDGKAQTYVPEMVTAKIDKVNRNTLTATTTDGTDYVESEVHEHILSEAFESRVRNLSGTWTYDLYLDRGGYLATFTQTTTAENYALLVDGWYMAQRGGDEYAAKVYNRETKELDDTTITSGGSMFIGGDDTLNNSWKAMRQLGGNTGLLNDDNGANSPWIRTTVGALDEDGTLVPVDRVYNENSRVVRMLATRDNKIPGRTEIPADAFNTTSTIAYNNQVNAADAPVEVRALTSTVYYYVYPLSGNNYLVKEYVGYANIPDVKAADIDDVYAVGSQQSRLSGIGNDVGTRDKYFTADVVVVEMNKYEGAAEEVFIYDVPEVHNSVRIENVSVIRADGTNESVDIDFSRSEFPRGYSPAYGKYIDPGLYYMSETETEGLYTIKPMDNDDIRASRYATGWSATSYGTVDKDYVEVETFTYSDLDVAPFRNVRTGKTPEYKLTEDSKIYGLSYDYDSTYGYNTTAKDYSASLSTYDAEKDNLNDYLGEIVDYSNATSYSKNVGVNYDNDVSKDYWNHNDLLVKYNSSNQVVYAISFANFEGKGWNMAQYIWNDVKPSAAGTTAPTVLFYGVEDNLTGDVDDTVDGTITVSYATAKDATNEKFLDVKNAEKYEITGSTEPKANDPVSKTGETWNLNILGKDGKFYYYTLKLNAIGKVAKLVSTNASVATVDQATGEIDVLDPALSINEFTSYFEATVSVEWTFKTAAGNVINDPTQKMSAVAVIEAVVTAEDGETTATYYKKGDASKLVTVKTDFTGGIAYFNLYYDPADPTTVLTFSETAGVRTYSIPKNRAVYAVSTTDTFEGTYVRSTGTPGTGTYWEADVDTTFEPAVPEKVDMGTGAILGINTSDAIIFTEPTTITFRNEPAPTKLNISIVTEATGTAGADDVAQDAGITNNFTKTSADGTLTVATGADAPGWNNVTGLSIGTNGASVTLTFEATEGYVPYIAQADRADYVEFEEGATDASKTTWTMTISGLKDPAKGVFTLKAKNLTEAAATALRVDTNALTGTVAGSNLAVSVVNGTDRLTKANVTGTGIVVNGIGSSAADAEVGNESVTLPVVDGAGNAVYVNVTYTDSVAGVDWTGTLAITVTRTA